MDDHKVSLLAYVMFVGLGGVLIGSIAYFCGGWLYVTICITVYLIIAIILGIVCK